MILSGVTKADLTYRTTPQKLFDRQRYQKVNDRWDKPVMGGTLDVKTNSYMEELSSFAYPRKDRKRQGLRAFVNARRLAYCLRFIPNALAPPAAN